ncbi:hypothetical protein PHMEG_00034202 [Phytophthora megakarya]|uniref:Uncharacterized protein n=1 Tax=Phytophthora megakarya TaxID=4795 RepID=A0A225US10_9STRA|nr:hypothetical protein PHMEG_00034202 [Phytophthora megakarya]
MKLVKSREASLNVQISEKNVVIKGHQEMYDRLENRMQLALRGNKILTKEVNHGRSEYLVAIQAFKKSHENLHKLLSHTDPKGTTLTLKLREGNRDLVLRVKRLEMANSALGSRLRLEDMDPESLVLMVEAVYKVCLEDCRDRDTLVDDIARAKVRFAEMRAEEQFPGGNKGKDKAKRRRTGSDNENVDFGGGDSGEDAPEEGRKCSATPSSAATFQPQPKKQKASPPATPSIPAEKSQPSPKSPSSKTSTPAPDHHKVGSAPKKVDVTVSDAGSMSSARLTPKRKAAFSSEFRSSFRLAGGFRSDITSLTSESLAGQSVKSSSPKSTKSRSKKTNTEPKSDRSSSDESVISVSSEPESASS